MPFSPADRLFEDAREGVRVELRVWELGRSTHVHEALEVEISQAGYQVVDGSATLDQTLGGGRVAGRRKDTADSVLETIRRKDLGEERFETGSLFESDGG